jgi:hypothetical protein
MAREGSLSDTAQETTWQLKFGVWPLDAAKNVRLSRLRTRFWSWLITLLDGAPSILI